jgi:hypothetical protein
MRLNGLTLDDSATVQRADEDLYELYEASTAVVEHKDKDQTAGLEIAESLIFCGHQV